jgi:hypothetical protein
VVSINNPSAAVPAGERRMLEDRDDVEVLKAMAIAQFAGSVIVVSGMNAARRVESWPSTLRG